MQRSVKSAVTRLEAPLEALPQPIDWGRFVALERQHLLSNSETRALFQQIDVEYRGCGVPHDYHHFMVMRVAQFFGVPLADLLCPSIDQPTAEQPETIKGSAPKGHSSWSMSFIARLEDWLPVDHSARILAAALALVAFCGLVILLCP